MVKADTKQVGDANSARVLAVDALGALLRNGKNFDQAFNLDTRRKALSARDAAFARLMLLTTLRHLGDIDAALAACLDRPLSGGRSYVMDLLRLGACQLLYLSTPPHAAVSTMVALVKAGKFSGFRGLVNAVLRRIAREGTALLAPENPARNTPDWLWQAWTSSFGAEHCRAIAAVHVGLPPLDLTVKANAAVWAERLNARLLPTGSVRLDHQGPVQDLPGFDEGAWWVQDAAAALPASLLGNVEGKHVIDIGAAPGGKTAQLAHAGARVTAIDKSGRRLTRLHDNLVRLSLTAEVVEADATVWQPSEPADMVLLDAPCSATGTIRRHPEIPWLRRPADIARLAKVQDSLLDAAATMLKSDGLLVYVSCSLQPEECEQPISTFLERHPNFSRVPIAADEIGGLREAISPIGDLRTLPCHLAELGGVDGFFAARLRRDG